jgi:hypothetical protein
MSTLTGNRKEFPPQKLNESETITILAGIIGIFYTLGGMSIAPGIGHVIKPWLFSK